MKQKMVIKVCMCSDKCRSKAMALAAATCGVESVALDGKLRDELVVVGDDVDSTKLTTALRKKVGWADILLVTEVKKDDKKLPPPPPPPPLPPPPPPPRPPPPPPQQPTVTVVLCQCHHYHYRVGDVCPWCGGCY